MSERSGIKALFVLTLAIGAAALFMVQPMSARMVLPHLGGSPSVWTTCMLFFQAVLLAGYLFAHASRWLSHQAHTALHLGLVLAACAFLPVFGNRDFGEVSGATPGLWLLATLLANIGVPCLVLASSAPLLQLWFTRAGSGGQRDPYFLYAASNAGSLLGLLAYPFLLEPLLTLQQQCYVWSACFGFFAVLTACCAFATWRKAPEQATARSAASRKKPALKRARALGRAMIARWLFLAFLPSSLLLSVTVHLTADVASIPFLWVVPLGLYLVTYIIAFSARGSGSRRFWIRWLPLVVLILAIVLLTEATAPLLLIVFLHLAGLFWIGMLCHGELARSRPPVGQLTAFYLCIAIGGALGGVVNALIAPAVFDSLAEYPLALVLACLVPAFVPSDAPKSSRRAKSLDVVLPALLVGFTALVAAAVPHMGIPAGASSVLLIFGLPLAICYTFSARPIRFALGIAGILLASRIYPVAHGKAETRMRSFFGVHRVTNDGSYRMLVHGNTEHGRQSLDPARRGEALSYYFRSGPIGELLSTLGPSDARLQHVAVIGLGAGTLAAYAERGQHWDFYEIDPSVVFIARESGYFSYFRDAAERGAKLRAIQGDGRIQLGRTDAQYGLIVLDAFGSDAIPTHLFTREALGVYRGRLAENGLIAIHYSSRYFDLRPVLGALGRSAQPSMLPLSRDDLALSESDKTAGKAPSRWAVFARSAEDPAVRALLANGWRIIEPDSRAARWTDDHANVLRSLQMGPAGEP